MLGAIIGDIVGSRFEWDNYKAKDFEFLTNDCFFTDDSVMSLALCEALLESKPDFSDLREQAVVKMRAFGDAYPDAGYGRTFSCWLYFGDPQPYNIYGNGSAMRVSGVVYAANTMEQVKQLSLMVTDVTHNHPEGIKGAEATAVAAFMATQICKPSGIILMLTIILWTSRSTVSAIPTCSTKPARIPYRRH